MPRASPPRSPPPKKPKPKQTLIVSIPPLSRRPAYIIPSSSTTTAAASSGPPTASTGTPAAVDIKSEEETIIIPPPRPPVVLAYPNEPWRHPDELEYIRPHTWSETTLMTHLLENAFSVPARHPPSSTDPWCAVISRSGATTIVPKGYRLPLMFAMKFQWESLRLVMSSRAREEEWKDYKFDILHVSRLCNVFLKEARDEMVVKGMDKAWRCHTFDRALTRYYRRWLVNREEFLQAFWKEFEEQEYKGDVLKKNWMTFVVKGHKGFRLTKDEVHTGLSWETLTKNLEERDDGSMYWNTEPTSMDGDTATATPTDAPTPTDGATSTSATPTTASLTKTTKPANTSAPPRKRKRVDEGAQLRLEFESKAREREEAQRLKQTAISIREFQREAQEAAREKKARESESGSKRGDKGTGKVSEERERVDTEEKEKETEKEVPLLPLVTPTLRASPVPPTTTTTTTTTASANNSQGESIGETTSVPALSASTSGTSAASNINTDTGTGTITALKLTPISTSLPPSLVSAAAIHPLPASSSNPPIDIPPISLTLAQPLSGLSSTLAQPLSDRTSSSGPPAKRGRTEEERERQRTEKMSTGVDKGRETPVMLEVRREEPDEKVRAWEGGRGEGNKDGGKDLEVGEKEGGKEKEKKKKKKKEGRSEKDKDKDKEKDKEKKGRGKRVAKESKEPKEPKKSKKMKEARAVVEEERDLSSVGSRGKEAGGELNTNGAPSLVPTTSKSKLEEPKPDLIARFIAKWSTGPSDPEASAAGEKNDDEEMKTSEKMVKKVKKVKAKVEYIMDMEKAADEYLDPMDVDAPEFVETENAEQKRALHSGKNVNDVSRPSSSYASSSTSAHASASASAPIPPPIDATYGFGSVLPIVPDASGSTLPPEIAIDPGDTLHSDSSSSSPPEGPAGTMIKSNSHRKAEAKSASKSEKKRGTAVLSEKGKGKEKGVAWDGVGKQNGIDVGKQKEMVERSPEDRLGGCTISWDARVSKALESASLVMTPAPETGDTVTAPVATVNEQRPAYYVPQTGTTWEHNHGLKGEQRERALQHDDTARTSQEAGSSTAKVADAVPAFTAPSGSSTLGSTFPRAASRPRPLPIFKVVHSDDEPATPAEAVSGPADMPASSPPPQSPPSNDLTAETSVALDTGAMDIDPSSFAEHSQGAKRKPELPPPSLADAPMESQPQSPEPPPPSLPDTPLETEPSQPRSPSPPQSMSPPRQSPSPQHDSHITRAPRRHIPPLPGPGGLRTFEEYQLSPAAWSGSDSSDHRNDGELERSTSEHDLQTNRERPDRHRSRFGEAGYPSYDGHHSYYHHHPSATPITSYHRHHPYPTIARPRYHSQFTSPYYSPYNYSSYPPSVSFRARRSVDGASTDAPSSAPPEIDPDAIDVDGSPVSTRIVSIVQDTMSRLADALSASRRDDRRRGKRRERSPRASGSGSRSVASHTEPLDMGMVMKELHSLKRHTEEQSAQHQRVVNRMHMEMDELRRKLQDLTRVRETDKVLEVIDVDNKSIVENVGVYSASAWGPSSASSPIDFTEDRRYESSRPSVSASGISRSSTAHPLAHLIGPHPVVFRRDTPTVIKIRDSNSPALAFRPDDGVDEGGDENQNDEDHQMDQNDENDGNDQKEKDPTVCPPHLGVSIEAMIPGHDGVPLPIKSQRKGRMVFIPIDMTGDSS